MNLVVITAFIAVCGAAKLDRTYLPPSSANTAGGSPGSLQAPFTRSSVQGLESSGLPTGSYTNNYGGVVVEAASPGTRASADGELSGLGGPRPSYGSTDSKVGDAAFRGPVTGLHNKPSFGATVQTNDQFDNHPGSNIDSLNGHMENGRIGNAGQFTSNGQVSGQNFQGLTEKKSERPQAASDRNSNIISLSNDVNSDSYSYGFETDNGIAVGENGVSVNGVQAEGGYSYQGDDGQVYKVTYTADEGGYRPQGDHLPTPPPIPEEILKSLEQNAKDEAAGLIDDGSYDAHKYNDGDYMHDNDGNIQYNGEQSSQFGKRPESDASASGSYINQNGQAFGKPESGQVGTVSDLQTFNGQSSHGGSGQVGISGSQLTLNGQSSQGHGKPGLGQSEITGSYSTFNGLSNQENVKPSLGQYGISGSQSTFNGQSSQENGKPGSDQFGITGSQSTLQGQSNQGNVKPGLGQSGITGSYSTFNGLSNQENVKPGSGQFGITGSQSTLQGQSNQGNVKPGFGQSGITGLQSTFNGQSSQGYGKPGSGQVEFSGSQSTFNGQSSQGNLKPGSGQFGITGSQSTFNGESSQGNMKTGSGQFGITGSQSTFNGQSSHMKPSSGQFGITGSQSTFNGQSSQSNMKPGSGQFGITGSQSTFNGQSSQGNVKPGSGQFGNTGSQSTFNGQTSQGNMKPGSGQFGITGSQSTFNGQSSQGNVKPGLGQSGITGSQSTFNQGNKSPGSEISQAGSAQYGDGSQTHASFSGQSGQENGNHFGSDSALVQHGDISQSSHSSQLLSGHHESSGQIYMHTGNTFSSPSALGQGTFENQALFGSQPNQQALASAQFENQSPSSQPQHSSSPQFSSRPNKPLFGQSTGSSAFNSQSAQPQFGSSFKPQGSEAFSGASLNQDQDAQDFGKPFPQTFSGQNFNRPSAGNFNSNKPSRGQVQANKFESSVANSFNRFPQASSQNIDYLTPVISSGQAQPEKTEAFSAGGSSISYTGSSALGLHSNSQESGKNKQIPDFVPLKEQKPSFTSASATTSFGQPAFEFQSAKPLNTINTQPQTKPNLFQKQTTQFSSQNPVQLSSNSQQSASFAQTVSNLSSKPTAIPETELTTPLEQNNAPASSSSSQISSQTTSSLGSFNSRPAQQHSEKTQFGFQGNSAFGQKSTSQTLSPSVPTFSPQSNNAQFGTASTQSTFQSSKRPESFNDKPQFPQNFFGQNQQNQPLFSQGVENSYYYNQPSKPFSMSGVHPQGSRFPTSPSYQPTGVASQNQFLNQESSFQSSSKSTGSLAPTIPTSASHFAQTQGYNGITQAAISPFSSVYPTPSSQISSTQNSQFASKPTYNQQSTFNSQFQSSGSQQSNPTFPKLTGQPENPSRLALQFGQKPIISESQALNHLGQSEKTPESSDGSSQQQTSMTQQYQGTVYEYNKPAEVLPASTQTSSSQTIQSGITSESKPSFVSQENQLSSQQNSKPLSQFGESGSILGAQNKPVGSTSTSAKFGQHTQTGHGSQTAQPGPFNAPSTSAQFSQTAQLTSDSSSSTAMLQNAQGSQQPFKPFGSPYQGIQSSFDSRPQSGSQTTQFSQNTQTFGSSQISQPARVSSQSQFSSQTFGNAASGQDNGYFYPRNPKPQSQIAELTKNQFSQNSQSGSPLMGSSLFKENSQTQFVGQNSPPASSYSGSLNQQTTQNQFNSASKPQFGAPLTQFSQNTQAQFGHKLPNSPIHSFSQPTASSQAIASGQASASASALSSPQQQYRLIQNKNHFGQIQKSESQDQNGQGSQLSEVQNLKPFSSNVQKPSDDNSKPYGALKPVGAQGSAEVSKPIFSPCCQGSKGSTSTQSTDKPSQVSFQGTQNFNAQDLAGKGEEFGGPRQPSSFDVQTGYHY